MAPMTHTKRLIKVVNSDIDERIKEAKAANISALDVAMLDKLLRPFTIMLEVNRQANTSPSEFSSSVMWILSVIITETVLASTPKNQPDQVYAVTNGMMQELADEVTKILAATVEQPKIN